MVFPHEPVNVLDFETIARARMEPGAYDDFAGAAGDPRTLAESRLAFDRIGCHPRVLVDGAIIDLATTILGDALSWPLLLAPTALAGCPTLSSIARSLVDTRKG